MIRIKDANDANNANNIR